MPPRVNSSTATRNAQKYTALPYPRGCLASGARLASFMPNSSSTRLPQSAAEWIASASIALEPVTAAATALAIRIPLLAPSAYSTARNVEACDMNSPPPLPCPLPRGGRECETMKYLKPAQRTFSAPGEELRRHGVG